MSPGPFTEGPVTGVPCRVILMSKSAQKNRETRMSGLAAKPTQLGLAARLGEVSDAVAAVAAGRSPRRMFNAGPAAAMGACNRHEGWQGQYMRTPSGLSLRLAGTTSSLRRTPRGVT